MLRFLLCAALVSSTAPAHAAPEDIAGTLTVEAGSPVDGAALFLSARPEGATRGPPTWVKKLPVTTFPLPFTLGPADAMLGGPTPASLVVTARLDRDGDAATKGADDLVATSAPLAPGAQGVTLTLARSAPIAEMAAGAADAPGVVTGVDAASVIGPPAGPPLDGEALREATMTAGRLLRCVVCQGLSVADSPSETAKAMRGQVETLVAQGYDTEQVLAWFEASYGAFVRLEPTSEGINGLVWIAPAAVVLIGALAILLGARRGAVKQEPVDADDPLAPWLARVRADTRPDAGEASP